MEVVLLGIVEIQMMCLDWDFDWAGSYHGCVAFEG
jgi:hypothetical protein